MRALILLQHMRPIQLVLLLVLGERVLRRVGNGGARVGGAVWVCGGGNGAARLDGGRCGGGCGRGSCGGGRRSRVLLLCRFAWTRRLAAVFLFDCRRRLAAAGEQADRVLRRLHCLNGVGAVLHLVLLLLLLLVAVQLVHVVHPRVVHRRHVLRQLLVVVVVHLVVVLLRRQLLLVLADQLVLVACAVLVVHLIELLVVGRDCLLQLVVVAVLLLLLLGELLAVAQLVEVNVRLLLLL